MIFIRVLDHNYIIIYIVTVLCFKCPSNDTDININNETNITINYHTGNSILKW